MFLFYNIVSEEWFFLSEIGWLFDESERQESFSLSLPVLLHFLSIFLIYKLLLERAFCFALPSSGSLACLFTSLIQLSFVWEHVCVSRCAR